MKRKQNKNWIKNLKMVFLSLFSIVSLSALIAYAFIWAVETNRFELARIVLTGQSYLERNEILKYLDLPRYPVLLNMDLQSLQSKLEKHPYIKAARISRDFPHTLRIDIVERVPIAYINHSPLYLVDDEGVVLPTRNGSMEFDVPMLSGFNSADELYPIGLKCLSQKVNEAVYFLNHVKTQFPVFYKDISEVIVNPKDEYELYLTKKPTKIYLGSKNLIQHLILLQQFANSLKGIRSIYDYQYVDLRYYKQIVAKERV